MRSMATIAKPLDMLDFLWGSAFAVAFGVKADMTFAAHMSAFDPKRTLRPTIAAVSIWQKLTTPWQQIARQTQINAAEIV